MNERADYDNQLPWLQAVEDEDEPTGLSARKMLVALMFVVLAIAILSGTFFWLGRRDSGANGPPELIAAPSAPYKVKPDDPGGLDVAGESQTAFETSAGEDPNAQLDLSRGPGGTTVTIPDAKPAPNAATPEPAPAPVPVPTPAPAAAQPKPSGATGSTVQLGAFKNRQQAERAWTILSARFPAVAGLGKMIVPFPGGIRLRAAASSPDAAREVCRTLSAAGENCFVAR
ncbi:MAG: SPOR domain-containing protein [Sphingomicrobium sp.]